MSPPPKTNKIPASKKKITRHKANASLKKLFAKLPTSRKKHKNTESHTISLHKKKQKFVKLLEKNNITVSKSLFKKYKNLLSFMTVIACVAFAQREKAMYAADEARHRKAMSDLDDRYEYGQLMEELKDAKNTPQYYLKRLLRFVKFEHDKIEIQKIIDSNPNRITVNDVHKYLFIYSCENNLRIHYEEREQNSYSRIEFVIKKIQVQPPLNSPSPQDNEIEEACRTLSIEKLTEENVRKAYMRLVLKYHPDKNVNKTEEEKKKKEEQCSKIINAYKLLKNHLENKK